RPVFLQVINQCLIKFLGCKTNDAMPRSCTGSNFLCWVDIEMDFAQNDVVGAVTRNQILDEAAVGLIEIEIRFPCWTNVAPGGFEHRNEALCVQIRNLLIQALEVLRDDCIEIRQSLMVWNDLKSPITM